MSAKKKKKTKSTISISIYKNNDERITRITRGDVRKFMEHLTPKEEEKLARHIADALGEPGNVEYFLQFTGYIPKEELLEKLAYVLGRRDIDNKAAYFTRILKSYGKPRYPRR